MKSLKTVTDSFSLIDKVRKYTTQNNRNYLIKSVRDTFNLPENKERMALGEMYGYYGHGRRSMHYARTKKMDLPETAVVMVDGKPVVLENVPSNRTLSISVDDDGIVTHTQEILDTTPGQIVMSMIDSQAGGWSWATHGDGYSVVKSFHGVDYVTIPNFISRHRQVAMMESAGSDDQRAVMHANLMAQGFSDNVATDLIQHFDTMQQNYAMFESVDRNAELEAGIIARDAELEQLRSALNIRNTEQEAREKLAIQCRKILRKSLNEMPVFVSDDQRRALFNMASEEDARTVSAMLESLGSTISTGLPITPAQRTAVLTRKGSKDDDDKNVLLFV